MEFGLKPAHGGQNFELTLDQTIVAEEYGFDSVYFGQHHGFPQGGYWPSPLVTLSAIATRTSYIRLGTSILQLPLETPVALAGQLAQLDVISDGRVSAAVGVGWRDREFEAFGVPKAERGPRSTEYLRVLNALFEPGPTSFSGRFVEFEEFELTPRPVQSGGPELLFGGVGNNALRRGVELADGINPPGSLPIEELAEFVGRFRTCSDGRVVITADEVVVRTDTEAARQDATDKIMRKRRGLVDAEGSSESYPFGAADIEAFERELERDFDRYAADRTVVVGTPEECTEKIEWIIEETDCDELTFRPSTPGWEDAKARETIDRLGQDVLPAL